MVHSSSFEISLWILLHARVFLVSFCFSQQRISVLKVWQCINEYSLNLLWIKFLWWIFSESCMKSCIYLWWFIVTMVEKNAWIYDEIGLNFCCTRIFCTGIVLNLWILCDFAMKLQWNLVHIFEFECKKYVYSSWIFLFQMWEEKNLIL